LEENQPEIIDEKVAVEQEQLLLKTIPSIKKIAARKLSTFYPAATDDIVQKVFLKLWNWVSKSNRQPLTEEAWQKLANRATQNEIKTFYSHKSNKEITLFEDGESIEANRVNSIEGNSEREINSVAMIAWNEISRLSLRQKYALLLQKQELILYLVGSKCCQIEEIARELQLSRNKFLEIFQFIPLTDEKISVIFFEITNEKLTVKQVWEARSKARTKLGKVLK
jgi:DNA-directed RNA polymerase specialized sigma24 family protein